MKRLRIAFVHHRDAREVRTWSGIPLFLKRALERHVGTVVDLSPAPVPLEPFRVARGMLRAATGRSWSYDHEPALAWLYGRVFSRRLAAARPDFVFSPAASVSIAHVTTPAPVVYYSDATFRAITDYYIAYSSLAKRTARAGDELEQRVLGKAAIALFSSAWAAESAVRDYNADAARVFDVGIGANLEFPPARDEVLPRRPGATLRLLFVGVRWRDKGGDIALRTLLRLCEMGIDAELTVVGCTPPRGVGHPRLQVIPFLNKSISSERERFERLWREADVFLLPTRYEAAGVVFCEAAAHALPVFATRTGGVPSLVRDGENGFTLPAEADGDAYAARIAELYAAPDRYSSLCVSSRNAFEQRLNWDVWGQRVARIVEDRLPQFRGRTLVAGE